MIKQFRFNRRSRSLSVCGLLTTAVAVMAASPALAAQIDVSGLGWTDASSCSPPALTQPFALGRGQQLVHVDPG